MKTMLKLGAIFPQTESGSDPVAMRDYVQAAEEIGFDHLLLYDHVLGADPATRPCWRANYTYSDTFQEPFTFLAFVAALTQRLELATGVVVLPQRQTALVAKQAAEIDVLSGGRLRLGVGIGWNEVEFQALGSCFRDRGARIEEQIAVLRQLWTKPLVRYTGLWHRIEEAGINPLPIQRPIPIWMGGWDDRVLRRVARLADGWFPLRHPPSGWQAEIDRLRSYTVEAGRDPDSLGIEPRFTFRGTPDAWRKAADNWRALGVTHLSVNTMGIGLTSMAEHIEAIRLWHEAIA
jgi:probable F420-dependent oxidoreductase